MYKKIKNKFIPRKKWIKFITQEVVCCEYDEYFILIK